MKDKTSDLIDMLFAVVLATGGIFACVVGFTLHATKLSDLGLFILIIALFVMYFVRARFQERKHYKKIMDELKEMKKSG